MGAKTTIGLVLIILGILSFVYQGIQVSDREQVLKVGPVEATAETTRTIPLQPWLGGMLVAGGVVLIAVGNKRRPARP
jgi:hypothetical protein